MSGLRRATKSRVTSAAFFMVASIVLLTSCTGPGTPTPTPVPTSSSAAATLVLSSSAFRTGEKIPDKYTCQGDSTSPPLSWNATPAGTQSFALITEDIDGPSGIITHWIVFNIPPGTHELAGAIPVQEQLPGGALQGNNIRSQTGYTGPCPPAGTKHRYEFTLFALDQMLPLKAGATRADLIPALQGHILAVGQVMGVYQKP